MVLQVLLFGLYLLQDCFSRFEKPPTASPSRSYARTEERGASSLDLCVVDRQQQHYGGENWCGSDSDDKVRVNFEWHFTTRWQGNKHSFKISRLLSRHKCSFDSSSFYLIMHHGWEQKGECQDFGWSMSECDPQSCWILCSTWLLSLSLLISWDLSLIQCYYSRLSSFSSSSACLFAQLEGLAIFSPTILASFIAETSDSLFVQLVRLIAVCLFRPASSIHLHLSLIPLRNWHLFVPPLSQRVFNSW